MTDDQVEKLTVGDRIKLGALTGTIVQAVGLFVAIQWDEKSTREPLWDRPVFTWAEGSNDVCPRVRRTASDWWMDPGRDAGPDK